jgi:hypothetical protein
MVQNSATGCDKYIQQKANNMNFKNFLNNDTMLYESSALGDPKPAVVAFGSFSPLHIGYLPMIAEMLRLSEQHNAEAILTIIHDQTATDEAIESTVTVLQENYAFLKVVVERDVAQSLKKLSNFDRKPIAILGDSVMVQKAKAMCKLTFENHTNIIYAPGYLQSMQTVCMEAVKNDDIDTFRSHVLMTEATQVTQAFDALKEVYGKQ